jgi:hypothetical protein
MRVILILSLGLGDPSTMCSGILHSIFVRYLIHVYSDMDVEVV